jgi:hypothetical protein
VRLRPNRGFPRHPALRDDPHVPGPSDSEAIDIYALEFSRRVIVGVPRPHGMTDLWG